MANRIFRLSISPDDAPEVRRVIDFDGRDSLSDVHEMMRRTLKVGDHDHLYAFFLSGRYWDQSSEYVDPRSHGKRADQALLFRLRLQTGQRFVYVYDFGEEHRYSLSVVSVTEAEAPLLSPVLIESVGDAPLPSDGFAFDASEDDEESEEDDEEGETDRALKVPLALAAAVVEQAKALDDLPEDASAGETRTLLRKLGEAALAYALGLEGNLRSLAAVDREFDLSGTLLDLLVRLSENGEADLAVRIAQALEFGAPDNMKGEIALAYARAGDRDRALSQVLTNLETAEEPFVAEYKAGDVYLELAEPDAAEAYYRRSLSLAETASDRREATLRIASLMIDSGREAEAAAFVSQHQASAPAKAAREQLPAVGRNEPCPCGSGKKYKKCHGA